MLRFPRYLHSVAAPLSALKLAPQSHSLTVNHLVVAITVLVAIAFNPAAGADDAATTALPVLEEKPGGFASLGTVTASSKGFSGRTDNGKRSYVMRELQRQARKLGAEVIWLKKMQRLERRVPVYGRFNTITQYEKEHEYLGSGEAMRLVDPLEDPVESLLGAPPEE